MGLSEIGSKGCRDRFAGLRARKRWIFRSWPKAGSSCKLVRLLVQICIRPTCLSPRNFKRIRPFNSNNLYERLENHTFVWLVVCCGSSHLRNMKAHLEPHEFIAAAISWKSLPFTYTDAVADLSLFSALRSNSSRDSVMKAFKSSARVK